MKNQFLEEFLREFLPTLLICGVFIFIYLRKYLRNRKAKKLKYEGIGVVKNTKVFAVREKYVSGGRDSSGYYVYRLESKDEIGNIYKSDKFKNAEHGGRTLEEMVKKYDGVVYDLGNKEVAIKQINDNIQRLEMELQNDPGFFKKRSLKGDIEAMKKYIEIANEGPLNPYLVCHGHKISVGDSVTVFVDPEDSELYYFDLDFTKENK